MMIDIITKIPGSPSNLIYRLSPTRWIYLFRESSIEFILITHIAAHPPYWTERKYRRPTLSDLTR